MNFRTLIEGIKKLPDDKMDDALKGKDTITFEYNAEAVAEFAKKYENVYITKDRKYFHILDIPFKDLEKSKIVKKYNLKEI